MDQAFQDVLVFHRKFCPDRIGTLPAVPPAGTVQLRMSLIDEEFEELTQAMLTNDLPGIADSAVDLMYVVLGMLVSYGIDPTAVWNEVHAANMAKEGGGSRPDGKILKPPGWQAPDVAAILERQHPISRLRTLSAPPEDHP